MITRFKQNRHHIFQRPTYIVVLLLKRHFFPPLIMDNGIEGKVVGSRPTGNGSERKKFA